MRVRLFKKLKQNKAFTLAELLVTVAIITVLLGMSMIGLYEFSITTKMTELDSYAKTIYLEAQNQLTAKKIEGSNVAFLNDISTNYTGRALTDKPSDYTGADDKWKELYYLTKVDDATKDIVYVESDLYGKDFIIELNPQNGDIYGVFCWESDETENTSYYENYYNGVIKNLTDRKKSTRRDIKLGYYGGSLKVSNIPLNFKLNQKVEVVNEEELYLKVTFDNNSLLIAHPEYFETKCVISANGVKREIILDDPVLRSGDDVLTTYFLLDSMEPGFDFDSIINGGVTEESEKIKHGDNFAISVISKFEFDTYICKEQSPQYITNSMFGKKDVANGSTIITINALRHFRYLNSFVPEQDGVFVIQLTDDIDFATNEFAWKMNDLTGKLVAAGEKKGNRPAVLAVWTPLENSVLFENTAGSNSDKTIVEGLEGKSYTFRNFDVTGGVGIFKSAVNVDFKNIKIEDINVGSNTANGVGALAGTVKSCFIENCGVYLTTYKNENGGKTYYSSIVINEEGYKNEMDKRCDTYKVTGNKNVGGLIGVAEDSILTKCYTAIRTEGKASTIGGFIGSASNVQVSDSYASGRVTGVDAVGGFIGSAKNVTTVQNAYATGDVWGTTKVGGFVGQSNSGSYKECYSYGEILNSLGSKLLIKSSAGGFIGSNTDNTFSSCNYLSQKGYNMENSFSANPVGAKGYSEFLVMATDSDGKLSAGACYPYKDALLYGTFPFKKVLEHHYGDWPSQYVIDNTLVYYEKYKDGQYGFYCVTQMYENGNTQESDGYIWVLNTLLDNVDCVEDGYALLSMYDLAKFDYQLLASSEGTPKQGTLTVGSTVGQFTPQVALEFKAYKSSALSGEPVTTMEANGMFVYLLPNELQGAYLSNVTNFYDKLTLYKGYAKGNNETTVLGGSDLSNGLKFFYCPYFAKTAINPGFDVTNPSKVVVRTAKHLNALGRASYFWGNQNGSKITYEQEIDVNFGTYNVKYNGTNVPIGSDSTPFVNNYDGKGNRIIDYTVTSDAAYVGLFGKIEGSNLSNIIMTVSKEGAGSVVNSGKSTNSAGTGALVGLAYMHNNQITNCAAAGYKVETKLPSEIKRVATGGLIGYNMSKVSNCSAVNEVLVTRSGSYSGDSVFMAGLVGSHMYGTLEKSYSGGKIAITDNGSKPIGYLSVGGVTAGGLFIGEDTYTAVKNDANNVKWNNLYSYTELAIGKNTANTNAAVNTTVSKLLRNPSWSTPNQTLTGSSSQCYYLDTSMKNLNASTAYAVGTKKNYDGLVGLTTSPFEDRADASHTYPISAELKGNAYPFPAFITGKDGQKVHYGDWAAKGKVEEGEKIRPFQIGASEATLKEVELKRMNDGTFYADFILDESLTDNTLYIVSPIPELKSKDGKQIYLEFGKGKTDICNLGPWYSNSTDNATKLIKKVSIYKDTTYRLYIYGINTSLTGEENNENNATWEIKEIGDGGIFDSELMIGRDEKHAKPVDLHKDEEGTYFFEFTVDQDTDELWFKSPIPGYVSGEFHNDGYDQLHLVDFSVDKNYGPDYVSGTCKTKSYGSQSSDIEWDEDKFEMFEGETYIFYIYDIDFNHTLEHNDQEGMRWRIERVK